MLVTVFLENWSLNSHLLEFRNVCPTSLQMVIGRESLR